MVNYFNRVLITFENTFQLFYFCMKMFDTGAYVKTLEKKFVE